MRGPCVSRLLLYSLLYLLLYLLAERVFRHVTCTSGILSPYRLYMQYIASICDLSSAFISLFLLQHCTASRQRICMPGFSLYCVP